MEARDVQINPSMKKILITGNSKFRSSYDFQLTEEDMEKAYNELGEKEGVKEKCLQILKRKLKEDKDFFYRIDDNYLLRYLRLSKFNCEKAYTIIHKFYALRKNHPELFALPLHLKEFVDNIYMTCLPYTDEEEKWNVDEMSINDCLLGYNIVSDVLTMNPHIQINGLIGIWDFTDFTARHVAQIISPKAAWVASKLLQDLYPWRVKYILGIHCNPLIKAAFNAVRFFLKKKISDRIIFMGSDMTELHQYVNPALLPKDCGGTLEDSELTMHEHIVENEPYLKYERSFGLL